VRTDRYKYIYVENPLVRKDDTTYRNIEKYSLFDLKHDAGEQRNIYAQNGERARELHRVLEETMEESLAIRKKLESKHSSSEGEPEILPGDIETLRALGYLN